MKNKDIFNDFRNVYDFVVRFFFVGFSESHLGQRVGRAFAIIRHNHIYNAIYQNFSIIVKF